MPLFVLALSVLLEGPVATVLGGAMVGAGLVPFVAVLAVVVVAEVASDCLWFALGRQARRPRVSSSLARVGLTDERLDRVRLRVRVHLPRAVLGAKLVDVGAIPVFVAAGMAEVRLARVTGWSLVWTLPRVALLSGIGVLAGDWFAERLAEEPWLLVVLGAVVAAGVLAVHRLTRRILTLRGRRAVAPGRSSGRRPGAVIASALYGSRLPDERGRTTCELVSRKTSA